MNLYQKMRNKLEEEDKVKSESFIKKALNFNKLDIYLSNEKGEKWFTEFFNNIVAGKL